MPEEEINYRNLRKIQQLEKNSTMLTELTPDFYIALSEYLKNLETRFEKESSSQKQLLIKDEIENTKKIAMNIYEQREKKILFAAISKVRSGNPELKNITNQEKNLFDSILNTMLNSRKEILEKEYIETKTDEIKTVENKEEKKEYAEEKTDYKEDKQENSNHIVRITQDLPEFIGTDEKKYNLLKNDVISLPKDMSDMLSKRGVITKIEH
jgi:DNA replication factor GINS